MILKSTSDVRDKSGKNSCEQNRDLLLPRLRIHGDHGNNCRTIVKADLTKSQSWVEQKEKT